MMQYLQDHEDLQAEDVFYNLGDFKDFDEQISYVDELELRSDHYVYKLFQLSSYNKETLPNGSADQQ